MSYGANFPNQFRRGADLVDKLLRGAKPGDIFKLRHCRLFSLVVVLGLDLLLLLGGWLRLLGYGRRLDNCRFLFFREPQPALRHVENDGAIPFKGDFALKV